MNVPKFNSYSELQELWINPQSKIELINSYIDKETNFIPYLLPEDALKFSVSETIDILTKRFGSVVNDIVFEGKIVNSPLYHHQNTLWLKRSNMVGINIRTIGNVFNVVKYALTIPNGCS